MYINEGLDPAGYVPGTEEEWQSYDNYAEGFWDSCAKGLRYAGNTIKSIPYLLGALSLSSSLMVAELAERNQMGLEHKIPVVNVAIIPKETKIEEKNPVNENI
ncbi:hypothetical protein K8R33_03845 [archaeon]|nr:hypothetical protein [archaeon]